MSMQPSFDRRSLIGGIAAFGGLALLPGCTATPARVETAAAPVRSWTALKALADRYVAQRKVAGMIIGVGTGDAPAVYTGAGALGLLRDTPVDAKSIWRIYSMTKPVTGVLAAQLISEGKLGLDQPIAEIIPAFRAMKVATDPARSLEVRAASGPITVRHLLTHTAGLTYHFQPGAVGKAYRRFGLMPGTRTVGREAGDGESPGSLQAFANAVAELPLVADPGTTWHYSIALDVLGAVIEKAAGKPFETVMQERLLTPLAMHDTGFAVPAAAMNRFATNYLLQSNNLVPIDTPPRTEYAVPASFPAGGGGLVSTAADYMRFMRMVANGGRDGTAQIISPEAAKLTVSNLLPAGVFYEGNQGYGAGGRVVIAPGPGLIPGSYGWGGAAGTLASALPAQKLSIVLMTQYMPQQAYPLAQDLGV
ncbi:serine hydrolase domain-containing protein [Sphingosinicella soli]|uniref:CubicO group peptidase (Beta-lactamase class C family) n=1 Tax=Sphingosinicella soli TaxID=333708 RepID=A0A7W7B1E1_9SPHN|nr:serine hydrolase domain-containing protein [Sphingosinicella soli]MBB4631215.1 CubicO group peptidase (beta-lactamase class C family) [Sphingosinicella soli]